MEIEMIGLNDLGGTLVKVEENGDTPLENAIIKAKAYYPMNCSLYFFGAFPVCCLK